MFKNRKQLFLLSVTSSVFIGAGTRHLFILISYLYIHEVPTKHPWEKNLDPRNNHKKKFQPHEIPTRKNFGPTKYHEKKIEPTKYSHKKISNPRNIHEKNFGPTKYPWKKIGPTKTWWHHGTRPTRPRMAWNPRNLAHSFLHSKVGSSLQLYWERDPSTDVLL